MNDAFAFFFFFCHHVRNQGRVPRDLRDLLDAEDQLFVRRERELEAEKHAVRFTARSSVTMAYPPFRADAQWST